MLTKIRLSVLFKGVLCLKRHWKMLKLGQHGPFKGKKFFVPFMGFMVLFSTGLNSRFQRKNRFWRRVRRYWPKRCKICRLGLRPGFWHNLVNILRPVTYFSKPIFALNLLAQAGRFEYHEAYNRTYKGVQKFWQVWTDLEKVSSPSGSAWWVLVFFWYFWNHF